MVYGHGSFTIGRTLEEAYANTATLEASCRILYLLRGLKPTAGDGYLG